MPKKVKAYIVIAQQEWVLTLGSNARNLAVTFNKDYPVIYVNPAADMRSIIKNIFTKKGFRKLLIGFGIGKNTIKVADQFWVHTPASIALSINWLRNTAIYNWCNQINGKHFFSSLKKALAELGWKNEECVVFNDSQMFTGLYTKKYLQPLLNFYYIRDNLIEHPYFAFHGSRIEPLTIESSDAIFANSAYLANYAAKHHTLSMDIGQGCELDMYNAENKLEIPADLAAIPFPRLGYIGFLTGERLDIGLLEELATLKKEWNWVLIGPEESRFLNSRLHAIPNVYFLGSKKPSELPAYTQHLDVCLNPQLINPLTVGNYPRKIDEYLAMGKATVATDTPAMHMFLPHVHLAIGANAYIKAIEKALKDRPKEEIQASIDFAKSHTWEACVAKIYSVQNSILYA